ncbi:restriction endonuclease subunit S [Kocuria marina]|uniref:restriction endonuclease subunit S n=1 Tax=Kocuria marina TaxID=223184 RepID=UPI00345F31A6
MRQAFPTRRLRYLADVNPPVPGHVRLDPEAEYRLLPMEAIHEFSPPDTGYKRPALELLSGYSYIEPTDVAYAKVTPCFENGKGLVGADLEEPVFATTEVTVLRPRDGVNQRFLSYVVQSATFRSPAISSMTGAGGLKRVSDSYIKDLHLPAPSICKQQQIADYLDHETAEIDTFITDQSRFVDLIEERTSVLIETIITGKQLGTTLRKESGSAWVGDIPNHWEMERISWLFSNVGSGTTPASDEVDAFNGTIPWVTSSELRETGISITKKLVSEEAVRKYSALRVHPTGSLMIAMYGATIGRLGWLEVPATVNQAICVFSDYRKGPSKYPFFALLAARRHLLTLASGGGQPNINQDKLRSLRIPIPPEHEQTDMVRSLDKSLRDATQLVREAKILIDLARERRAALITAAVTGQIDVTARNKPAAEQLEDDIAQGLHREYA